MVRIIRSGKYQTTEYDKEDEKIRKQCSKNWAGENNTQNIGNGKAGYAQLTEGSKDIKLGAKTIKVDTNVECQTKYRMAKSEYQTCVVCREAINHLYHGRESWNNTQEK